MAQHVVCSVAIDCRRGTADVLWFVLLFPPFPWVPSVGSGVFSPAIKKGFLAFTQGFLSITVATNQVLRSGCRKQSFYFCTLACHQTTHVTKAHCFSLVSTTSKLCVLNCDSIPLHVSIPYKKNMKEMHLFVLLHCNAGAHLKR